MSEFTNTELANGETNVALEFARDLLCWEQCLHPDAVAACECADRDVSNAPVAERKAHLKRFRDESKWMKTTARLVSFADGHAPLPSQRFITARFKEYLAFAGPEKQAAFKESGLSTKAVADAMKHLAPALKPEFETPAEAVEATWPEIAQALRRVAGFAEDIEKGVGGDSACNVGDAKQMRAALELVRDEIGALISEFNDEIDQTVEWHRLDTAELASLKFEGAI